MAFPDFIISQCDTTEEEVWISSPTTACPPVHFRVNDEPLPQVWRGNAAAMYLQLFPIHSRAFALPVRKRARARASDGAELCAACLCRHCSPLLGRWEPGEAGRPTILYSLITIIEVPLGFTEVCAGKRESRGKEKEEEEWAS